MPWFRPRGSGGGGCGNAPNNYAYGPFAGGNGGPGAGGGGGGGQQSTGNWVSIGGNGGILGGGGGAMCGNQNYSRGGNGGLAGGGGGVQCSSYPCYPGRGGHGLVLIVFKLAIPM